MSETTPPPPSQFDKSAILTTIKGFLASTSNKPPPYPAAQNYILPTSHAVLIRPNGEITRTTLSTLITSIEERLANLYSAGAKTIDQVLVEDDPTKQPSVYIGGRLAAAWFSWVVRVDGQEKYHGVSAYTLFKRDEGWKIGAIADKRWAAVGESAPRPWANEVPDDMMEPNHVLCKLLNEERWDEVGDLMLPGGGATYMRYPDTLLMLRWEEFFSRMREMLEKAKPGYVHQELMDWEGWVCGDFGLVWTPFTVALDGEVRIRGFNVFTMVKMGGRWLISGAQDG